jgi:membrane-associated phospholipid phosphatase
VTEATPHAPRPLDILLGVYTLFAGCALFFPHRTAAWPLLAAAHLLFAAALFRVPPVRGALRACARRFPRTADFIAEWYPLILLVALYRELEPLNHAVFGGAYFDDLIRAWEGRIFGGQPSHAWGRSMPVLALSEVLHTAYISYYFAIYVPSIVVWVRRPREDFRILVFTIMATFVAHYVFFIFFPVQGPRYLYPSPEGGIEAGLVYRLVHRVLETGSAQGAAFPSSHVGATVAIAIAIGRIHRVAGWLLGLLAVGVAAGAVYGGFHYALDVAIGAALGILVAIASPHLHARLERAVRGRPAAVP